MSTTEEIRARIAATHRRLKDIKEETVQAERETAEAIERQKLRRMLETLEGEVKFRQWAVASELSDRQNIDKDLNGPHRRNKDSGQRETSHGQGRNHTEAFTRSGVVVKGECVWHIGQISWLKNALKIEHEECLYSDLVRVGGSIFCFQYLPAGGGGGTLGIMHESENEDDGRDGVSFRYRIFIRNSAGDFVQWGETGDVCYPSRADAEGIEFGPDVPHDGGAHPQGIFGLNHEALVKSEWVVHDTLAVRFEVEVRLPIPIEDIPPTQEIAIPSGTIGTDLSSLLDTGKCSDVTFHVDGESIKVHSPILCARSEVFDKLFIGGMRESVSKEVQIEDCSALAFKALLRFVYTDDLSCMDQTISKETCNNRIDWLQSVLAVSHKYAVVRLQMWCEQKLCECIEISEVCSILCQAHLYDAKHLANACLNFVKEHYAAVIVTEDFGSLAKDWPEVMVKINLWMGGVTEATAKTAIEASKRATGKRKRTE